MIEGEGDRLRVCGCDCSVLSCLVEGYRVSVCLWLASERRAA